MSLEDQLPPLIVGEDGPLPFVVRHLSRLKVRRRAGNGKLSFSLVGPGEFSFLPWSAGAEPEARTYNLRERQHDSRVPDHHLEYLQQ